MKQPKTQSKVIASLLKTYRNWTREQKFRRHFCARHYFRKAGCKLLYEEKNMKTIAVAWHDTKQRLGRDLTPTELEDIRGWAA